MRMKNSIFIIIGILFGFILNEIRLKTFPRHKEIETIYFHYRGKKKWNRDLEKKISSDTLRFNIINKPITAAKISEILLRKLSGENSFYFPLETELINDEVWQTSTAPPPGLGGNLTIKMLKSNCMVIDCYGTK